MRRKTAEERYKYNIRKQQKALEEFAAHEIEWAGDLIRWYGLRRQDMPDDEYRYRMYAALLKSGGYDGRTDWG